MAKLTLIGTDHDDLEGERVLDRRLKKLEPSHILIEGSEANSKSIIEINREVKHRMHEIGLHYAIRQEIEQLFDVRDYEGRVAKRYGKQHKVPVEYYDDIAPMTEEEKRRHHEACADFIAQVKAGGPGMIEEYKAQNQKRIEHHARIAQQMLALPDRIWPVNGGIADEDRYFQGKDREVIMAEKCRAAVMKNPKGHVVAIAGNIHIMNGFPNHVTFYGNVRDLKPNRIFTTIK